MATGNIATDVELVRTTMESTAGTREEMVNALNSLISTINVTENWKGLDASAYKEALMDMIAQLKSSAAWMADSGQALINHAQALADRAEDSSAQVSVFENR